MEAVGIADQAWSAVMRYLCHLAAWRCARTQEGYGHEHARREAEKHLGSHTQWLTYPICDATNPYWSPNLAVAKPSKVVGS